MAEGLYYHFPATEKELIFDRVTERMTLRKRNSVFSVLIVFYSIVKCVNELHVQKNKNGAIVASIQNIVTLFTVLKYNYLLSLTYKSLIDLTAFYDKNQFKLVYILQNFYFRCRMRVYATASNLVADSITSLYQNAGWSEREVFDMYGIWFKGNTDLRRILTDYGFSAHPLRKEYPSIGEEELAYDLIQNKLVFEKVQVNKVI